MEDSDIVARRYLEPGSYVRNPENKFIITFESSHSLCLSVNMSVFADGVDKPPGQFIILFFQMVELVPEG